jgi:hypothetical protein
MAAIENVQRALVIMGLLAILAQGRALVSAIAVFGME